MTLGPKFYTKLVLAITRRRKRVRRSYRLESSPNCLNIPNLLSKQDFPKSEFSHKRPLREYWMTCFLYILLLIRFHFILFYFILTVFILLLVHIIILFYFISFYCFYSIGQRLSTCSPPAFFDVGILKAPSISTSNIWHWDRNSFVAVEWP